MWKSGEENVLCVYSSDRVLFYAMLSNGSISHVNKTLSLQMVEPHWFLQNNGDE